MTTPVKKEKTIEDVIKIIEELEKKLMFMK